MSPLPRHGREANILADVVKALLDRENRNYEAFTPIRWKFPNQGGLSQIMPECYALSGDSGYHHRPAIDWL